jgi:hypothetical protein
MELLHFLMNFAYSHPYWTILWLACGLFNDGKRLHDERILFHIVDLVGWFPALAAVVALWVSGPIGTLGLLIKWYNDRPRPYGLA